MNKIIKKTYKKQYRNCEQNNKKKLTKTIQKL